MHYSRHAVTVYMRAFSGRAPIQCWSLNLAMLNTLFVKCSSKRAIITFFISQASWSWPLSVVVTFRLKRFCHYSCGDVVFSTKFSPSWFIDMHIMYHENCWPKPCDINPENCVCIDRISSLEFDNLKKLTKQLQVGVSVTLFWLLFEKERKKN